MTTIEELREAADALEHEAEFNETISSRWSIARQTLNTRRISKARSMRAQADAMEQSVAKALVEAGLV